METRLAPGNRPEAWSTSALCKFCLEIYINVSILSTISSFLFFMAMPSWTVRFVEDRMDYTYMMSKFRESCAGLVSWSVLLDLFYRKN